jgi:hypothetical protein
VICKWVRFGYSVLPLPGWRAFLLERHLEHCSSCQGRILDNDAIRAMGTTADALQAELPLWPVPADRHQPRLQRLSWHYVLGLSAIAAMAWVVIEVSRFAPSTSASAPKGMIREVEEADESRVFAVLTAEIGAEPARPVIFKPQLPGMTIVWFEKTKN